jgi:hypothetical protein
MPQLFLDPIEAELELLRLCPSGTARSIDRADCVPRECEADEADGHDASHGHEETTPHRRASIPGAGPNRTVRSPHKNTDRNLTDAESGASLRPSFERGEGDQQYSDLAQSFEYPLDELNGSLWVLLEPSSKPHLKSPLGFTPS